MRMIDKVILSKVFFVIILAVTAIVASLYLYNIIRWGNLPDRGFYFRTATGVNIIGIVTSLGEEAGLRVGDRILSVNGKRFTNVNEFRKAYRTELGVENVYLVERGSKQFVVKIPNIPLGIRESFVRSGLPYLVGVCYILIGSIVFLMKPHQRKSWIFFLFGATFGILLMFLLKLGEMRPSWLGTLHILFYTFTPATFVHMAFSFPEERQVIKKFPYVQIFPYLISAFLFLSIRSVTPEMANVPRVWSLVLTVYLALSLFFFLASCVQLWITSSSEITKLRSKIILLGAAISASIPLSETVMNTVFHKHLVPSFNYYLPFLIVFPTFVGYSIVKHNLFDIDAIIKRTYGYIVTTGSVGGGYALFIFLTNLAFEKFGFTKSPILHFIFILGVVFFFNPIRNQIQRLIDRTFYRQEYDYREAIQRISDSLRSLLNFDEIGRRIIDIASSTLFMEWGCILIENANEKSYLPIAWIEKRDPLGHPIPLSLSKEFIREDDPLIQRIARRKKEVTVYDIQEDPFFFESREVYLERFLNLDAVLIVPIIYEERLTGLIVLGGKKSGKFYRQEDINLLRILANQGAIAIENARLHQARIEVLEQSRKELERLSKAKSRALDHLSHELRTPLSVVQGITRLIKQKTQSQTPPLIKEEIYNSLEKNLNRIFEIQQETEQIIRTYEKLEKKNNSKTTGRDYSISIEMIELYPFIEHIVKRIKEEAQHRDVQISLEGDKTLALSMDSKILEEILIGLIKNGVENTPDEGMIKVILDRKEQWIQIKVMDFGIGITKENQGHLFDGLFHTLDTELYSSKKPYDFGAGGKGLDLLRFKTYAQRYGFEISVGSERCRYLPTDRDLCPGRISKCPHCKNTGDCYRSGGSTFCLSFRVQ